jgi:hypothetical protein
MPLIESYPLSQGLSSAISGAERRGFVDSEFEAAGLGSRTSRVRSSGLSAALHHRQTWARDFGSDDYCRFGLCDVLNAVSRIAPGQRAHLLGFALVPPCCSVVAAAPERPAISAAPGECVLEK